MKRLLPEAFLIIFLVLFSGCDGGRQCDERQYDEGYDAAWEDEVEPSSFSSQQKKDGYEDGLYDSDMYDEGYDAGVNKKKPKYWDDDFYKDGYKEGKENRC